MSNSTSASVPPAAAPPSTRLTELDGLRGVLLLMMTVNHMPSPMRAWSSQPLGFTSSAEGFVFLSAFLAGLIYCRRAAKAGEAGARRALYQRAGMVLRAHYVSFAIVFVLLGLWLGPRMPEMKHMVWVMVDRPGIAAMTGVLLVYQPTILDILPLYVFLLAMTPMAFWIAGKWGWRWLLAGSGLLWAFSQRPPLKLKILELVGLGHPFDFSNFDQFAWQFLWILGLGLGVLFYRKPADRPLIDYSRASTRWVAALCAVPLVYLFLARHGAFYFNLNDWWWLLDKWRLGPLRMISFGLQLGLIITAARLLRPIGQAPALTFLGRHSLPVFCCHICLALTATGLAEHYKLSDAWCYGMIVIAVAALYAAAAASEAYPRLVQGYRDQRALKAL